MRKAIFAFVLAVCGAAGLIVAASCAQADGTKPAGLVVDAETGQVLVANRANAAWYPASLTKLMTAYVVFSDAVLRAMARELPRTPVQLRAISGVGEKKLADFGARFLETIAQAAG